MTNDPNQDQQTLGDRGAQDSAKGKIENIAGKIQGKAGEVLGNKDMQAEGAKHEIKGGAQSGLGNVEQKIDETLNP